MFNSQIDENNKMLVVNGNHKISQKEIFYIRDAIKSSVHSLSQKSNEISFELWFESELKKQLPEKNEFEIIQIKEEIIQTVKIHEEKRASLKESISMGRSKESWFAKETMSVTEHLTTQEAAEYLNGLDKALETANEQMLDTITTNSGTINCNPNLDGFIAEQHHVNTFNLKAEATGSEYRAEVVKPENGIYEKDSVDIVIKNRNGETVAKYQAKYYKDSQSTETALKKGDYGDQKNLIPEGQEITVEYSDVIEAPDGTKSTPLSKEKAKQQQEDAQKNYLQEHDYNDYELKDLAKGIGKEALQAGGISLFASAIINTSSQIIDGEVDGEKIVIDSIKAGTDTSVKVAAAGALKIASEKGILHQIPKGTPSCVFATIATIGVEQAKIVYKIGTGELNLKDGLDEAGQMATATVVGLAASTKGTAIGTTLGAVFGPIGAAIGGCVGGILGYMAGSTVGKAIAEGFQCVRDKVISTGKTIISGVKNTIKNFCNFIEEIF